METSQAVKDSLFFSGAKVFLHFLFVSTCGLLCCKFFPFYVEDALS